MAAYILIDNCSGYIWGDTRDINGHSIECESPAEACRVVDESLGEYDQEYREVHRSELAANQTGYHVYRVDVRGSEAVTVITDGREREQIDAVERDCKYVASFACEDAEEDTTLDWTNAPA